MGSPPGSGVRVEYRALISNAAKLTGEFAESNVEWEGIPFDLKNNGDDAGNSQPNPN